MLTASKHQGRAPAGSTPPVTITPTIPGAGSAAPGTHDLQALRDWRAASSSRALVLHGYDGKGGVTLIEWRNGARHESRYDSMSSAALALAAGQVAWRPIDTPEGGWLSRRARLREAAKQQTRAR